MTTKQKYHAMIIDSVGDEADWGFYDLKVTESSVVAMRCAEWTPAGGFDTFIAASEWKFIDTVLPEDDDE